SHATLKEYLQTSTENLYQVCKTITLAMTNQKKEINAMIESECIHISAFACNNNLYMNLKASSTKPRAKVLRMACASEGIIRTKGCPSGSPNHHQTNTIRDPSGFEYIDHK
ncbi:17493_t:CDS:2, partial [Cetraspora pellucida]